MTTGVAVVSDGKNLALRRLFDSTMTVVSQFKIGTGTTTPTNADTDLETPITAWNGGSDFGTFVVGYPSFDTTNNKVTVKCYLSTSQANGNTITEIGIFNTDGTPIMFSRVVAAGTSKTSNVELMFTLTFQLLD